MLNEIWFKNILILRHFHLTVFCLHVLKYLCINNILPWTILLYLQVVYPVDSHAPSRGLEITLDKNNNLHWLYYLFFTILKTIMYMWVLHKREIHSDILEQFWETLFTEIWSMAIFVCTNMSPAPNHQNIIQY